MEKLYNLTAAISSHGTILLQRRVEIPPDCPLCHKEVESRSHLFLDCEFSKPVWDNTILPLHILEASFESWLSQVVDLDDENKSRSIIAILWTVWKNMNEYVWNNKQWNVNAIRISVTNCIKDWQCWCDLQKVNTSSIPLQTVQRTQGIDASWVYCEVDASVIENSASFGAVIRTHSGLFLAAISGPLRLLGSMLCLATAHHPADAKDRETTVVQSLASTLAHSVVGRRLLAWSPAVSYPFSDLRLHPQVSPLVSLLLLSSEPLLMANRQ
nr:uncharacterized protein LOC109183758 [Ipomoea batatas]